jgi:peptide chain release factor subunit 1
LKEEYEKASNIESKFTRNNVQEALDSLLAKLRYLNKLPENGIVYFSGTVDTRANKTSMLNEVLIPPEPVVNYIYQCNSVFILILLKKCLESAVLMGLYFLI